MNKSSTTRGSFILGLALIFTIASFAQIELDAERDIGVSASVEPAEVPANGTGTLTVRIQLPENAHITSREAGFFFVEPDTQAGLTWGITSFPQSATWEGEDVYRGSVFLTKDFALDSSIDVGATVSVEGTVGYQVCTEVDPMYCTPPIERRFTSVFAVAPPAVLTGVEDGLTIEEKAKRALESGSLMALLWVFIGGLLLSFTPCVYPVIPITIAYIGGRSGGSRMKGFSLSLVFVLGLAMVYSSLGLVAAATGSVFGLSTQNPWVIGFVTLVFLVMGIGMMGAFEISLPSSIQTKLSSKKRSGYLGALFVGGTTGLIAAPCVGPVLVALLSWVSSSGNLFLGFLYLFVFACGLGSLFVVIGTFAGAMSALPTAGEWMDRVKQVFGVILIAMAFYFGRPFVPGHWYTILGGMGLLMLAGLLGGFTRLSSDASQGKKIIRGIAAFIMLIGAFYVLLGLARLEGVNFSGVQANPQAVSAGSSTHESGIHWIYDDETAAFEQAKQTGRPVMIDFWAEWCAACIELDHKTFSVSEVADYVNENFIPLKMDGSDVTDEIKTVWDRFGVAGLPTVLFYSSDGTELTRFEAFRTVEQVMPVLKEVSAAQTDGI